MMEGWKEYKIEEIADVVGGGTPSSKIDEYWNGEIPWITPNDLSGYPFKTIKRGARNISKIGLQKSSAKLHPVNTVLFTSRAPIGYMAIAKTKVATNQGFQSLRCKSELVDYNFIYYFLTLYRDAIASIASGATFPEVSGKKLKQFKIHLPPLPTQRKIAKILSAYDDLIENNLKRIKLLEEMAQNEFNEWYANNEDFEEVNLGSIIGHEIGGGWGAEEQSEEFSKPAYVIRGTDIDELPNGKIEKVPFRFHKKSNLASRKLQDGDIIFEVSGGSSYEGVAKTLLVTDELLKQFDNAVMPASFCKLARPIERKYSNFLFLFLRFLRKIKGTEVFEIRSASNIVNYNWTAFLKFQKIKKPSETELDIFNKMVEPIYKQVYKLGNHNQHLKEARDILLPRLMTGMIDVDKIELEL
jgi:type I restriction enzyme S subunit